MRKCLLLLLSLMVVWPAVAGRELNNRSGQYNGDYKATVTIRQDEKEDEVVEKVTVMLRERYCDIVFSPDRMERARVDQIYTTGYKTEITCRHPEKDMRFFIVIAADISGRF
jgi:hypothetical protein